MVNLILMKTLEIESIINDMIPQLTKKEKQEIQLYYKVYEKYLKEISDEATKDLIDHPVFGHLIRDVPKEVSEERNKLSNQLQKNAIEKDDWAPYIQYQIQQGNMYAKLGLEFRAWYEVVALVRDYMMPYLQKEYKDGKDLLASLNGMNRFFDIAMGIIGEAYLMEKKKVIRDEGEKIKKLNEELELKVRERTAKLDALNKELEQFVYIASHDLQEPLRTVSNFVGLIQESYSDKLDEDAETYLKFISNATAKMHNLILDLLNYSRVEKNVEFKEIDCAQIVNEVIDDLDASIRESKAKINFDKLPVIVGNDIKLKQLFQNLISNALKFRKSDVAPEIQINCEEKEHEFLFSVKDNGIGIEKQNLGKLFVIFQRLNNASEYPGTGIGLATCKKIVTIHHGKIWIESEFGKGSTFYFTISKNLK